MPPRTRATTQWRGREASPLQALPMITRKRKQLEEPKKQDQRDEQSQDEPPQKKRGRSHKNAPQPAQEQAKQSTNPPPKRRGRPPKNPEVNATEDLDELPKRKRGRPRKHPEALLDRAEGADSEAPPKKRGRGRSRKNPAAQAQAADRPESEQAPQRGQRRRPPPVPIQPGPFHRDSTDPSALGSAPMELATAGGAIQGFLPAFPDPIVPVADDVDSQPSILNSPVPSSADSRPESMTQSEAWRQAKATMGKIEAWRYVRRHSRRKARDWARKNAQPEKIPEYHKDYSWILGVPSPERRSSSHYSPRGPLSGKRYDERLPSPSLPNFSRAQPYRHKCPAPSPHPYIPLRQQIPVLARAPEQMPHRVYQARSQGRSQEQNRNEDRNQGQFLNLNIPGVTHQIADPDRQPGFMHRGESSGISEDTEPLALNSPTQEERDRIQNILSHPDGDIVSNIDPHMVNYAGEPATPADEVDAYREERIRWELLRRQSRVYEALLEVRGGEAKEGRIVLDATGGDSKEGGSESSEPSAQYDYERRRRLRELREREERLVGRRVQWHTQGLLEEEREDEDEGDSDSDSEEESDSENDEYDEGEDEDD